MKIGFDLDGIFIGTPPFVPKKLIEFFYRKHNHVLSYRFPSRLEQLFRKLTHIPFLRPPIKGNIAFLKNDKMEDTNTYYLISSRFSFLKNETNLVLQRYGLEKHFNGTFMNYKNEQPHIYKNRVIKETGIDIYIDDDLPLLEFLRKENPKKNFFWLNKKEKKKLSKNLFAITKFSEMFV